MTPSAELSNRPAVGRAAHGRTVAPGEITPTHPAAPSRLRPAPPAPVPPLAPPVRRRQVETPARYLVDQASRQVQAVRPPALRYGRAMCVVAAVTLAVVAGLSWTGQGASPSVPARTVIVQVGAGETVWDVAHRVAPQYDASAVVAQIRQLNGLVGSAVEPGEQLRVPDGR